MCDVAWGQEASTLAVAMERCLAMTETDAPFDPPLLAGVAPVGRLETAEMAAQQGRRHSQVVPHVSSVPCCSPDDGS